MNDDAEKRLNMLFATARSVTPDVSAVDRFFEARLIATIRQKRDWWQLWFSLVWRLIPAFITVVLVLGTFSFFMDKSQEYDIFAAIANDKVEYQLSSYLGVESDEQLNL